MNTLKTEGYSVESMSAWSGGSWRVVVCWVDDFEDELPEIEADFIPFSSSKQLWTIDFFCILRMAYSSQLVDQK
jgi:hypothetical protein